MSRRIVGIVDYSVGNLTSVYRVLNSMGYRCRISSDPAALNGADVLLLPGVGAFPAAMEVLHRHDLVGYIQTQARRGKPIVGICLGMQLMAESSTEMRMTAGLGLVPGQVSTLSQSRWHIGWNSIQVAGDDPLFKPSHGQSFYFNHSHVFTAPVAHQVAVAQASASSEPFAIAIRRDNLVGFQFHPEKSQAAGRQLLGNVIEGLCRA